MADDMLTPRAAADALGVTPRTVQRWIANGRPPAERVGGRVRVSRSSLATMRGVAAPSPTGPIRTLLIANRGEIVARVAATARRLGMRTIGVHAPDDAPPVGCDAVHPVPSYLDADALVALGRRVAADAIHPGYGFLAESPAFADSVAEAGMRWVGPPAAAIAAMGDKAAARRRVAEHGVPTVPGYDGPEQGDDHLTREAESIGYPLLVKPAAGGGGKGMHRVEAASDLPDALAAARREAARAFGDDRLILERYLAGARHIEIQVLFDEAGTGIHLGERDCSAQRRNQKVIEEAPGPSVDGALRERLGAAALAAASAVGYVSAGTIEFLVADDGLFWFLEMNTRLQVEHPVTEAVTGRDLVADQLRVAAGEPLGFRQSDVHLRGHAFEARLYAEDPDAGFLPASGRVVDLAWPEGVRVDTALRIGDVVGERYDPMLAKVIAHGSSRAQALSRLTTALDGTRILGLTTNLRYLRWLVRSEPMRAGELRTDSLAALGTPPLAEPSHEQLAAAGRLLVGNAPSVWSDGWRLNAPASALVEADGRRRRVELAPIEGFAPPRSAVVDGDRVHVDVEGRSVAVRLAPPPNIDAAARGAASDGAPAVLVAPMPGTVVALGAAVGGAVAAGERLVVIEAMKMEHVVVAPVAGTVTALHATVGMQVSRGDPLVEVAAYDAEHG